MILESNGEIDKLLRVIEPSRLLLVAYRFAKEKKLCVAKDWYYWLGQTLEIPTISQPISG